MSVLLKRKRGRPRLDESKEINDFDLSLLEEVKKYPIFYDKNNRHYRNRECTERLWNTVACNLNVTVNVVKNRMFQLRNRYNVEKRRLETSRCQRPGLVSSWPLYDSLKFLSDFNEDIRNYTLIANLQDKSESALTSSEQDEDDDDELESSLAQRNDFKTNENNDILQELGQSLQTFNYRCADVDVKSERYRQKFEAFGQFIASSLIEMNEMQALHLVKKFTGDLVELSKLGEGKRLLTSNTRHCAMGETVQHRHAN